MFTGKWDTRRVRSRQCHANLSTHIPFVINGTITLENLEVNHAFREGVADLLTSKKLHNPTDFISVDQARKQILLQTGRTVSHSTAACWVAQNNLGHKLPGHKGQWIVVGHLIEEFLQNMIEFR